MIDWPELGARLVMPAEAPLDYLVVFTPARRPFFCVEPVSHVTDAFNLAEAGRADSGDAGPGAGRDATDGGRPDPGALTPALSA